MADQNVVEGRKFKLFIGALASGNVYPGNYTVVCPAVDITLSSTTQFEDIMVPDCAEPDKPMARKSSPQSRAVDMTIGGTVDLAKLESFRVAEANSDAMPLLLLYDVPAGQGGGYYSGDFYVASIQHSMANRGVVKFSISLRAQGDAPWTALT